MKKTLITATTVLAIALSGTAAQARDGGTDLLIVNNGDGSDFFVPIGRWFSWLRF